MSRISTANLKDILPDNPIVDPSTSITIPFSDTALDQIEHISLWHANAIQSILSIHANSFDITISLAPFHPTPPSTLETLDNNSIELLFVQAMALFLTATSLRLNFIDFSTCQLLPGPRLRFPLFIDINNHNSYPHGHFLPLFRSHTLFKNTAEKHLTTLFTRLAPHFQFNHDEDYLYHYNEFSSHCLHILPPTPFKHHTTININIKSNLTIPTQIIKHHLQIQLNNQNEPTLLVSTHPHTLTESIRLLLSTHHSPSHPLLNDLPSLIDNFNHFLTISAFSHTILLLDHIQSPEDTQFLDFLLSSSYQTPLPLTLIYIHNQHNPSPHFEFDLVLNEKPTNKLESFLSFIHPLPHFILTPCQSHLLAALHFLPFPVQRSWLNHFLSATSTNESTLTELVENGYLKADSHSFHLCHPQCPTPPLLEPHQQEALLANLLQVIHSPALTIHYLLLTQQTTPLKTVLLDLLSPFSPLQQTPPTPVPIPFSPPQRDQLTRNGELPAIIHYFYSHQDTIHSDPELLELATALLIDANEPGAAHKLLTASNLPLSTLPLPLLLKKAHIAHLEHNYEHLGHLLESIKDKYSNSNPLSPRLQDEYNYLQFVYDFTTWETPTDTPPNFDAITGDLYRHRALIRLSDYFIYMGDIEKASTILDNALAFFKNHSYTGDIIETQIYSAKLLRQKKNFDLARSLYQDIFSQCYSSHYFLQAAYTAIDLANLYITIDQVKPAETWYKKALELFTKLDDYNGIILAHSNLTEIHKIKGNWRLAFNSLQSTLSYDTKHLKTSAMAVDYYNLAHLEFLKHRFKQAQKYLKSAISLFKKKKQYPNIIECLLLQTEITISASSPTWANSLNSPPPLLLPDLSFTKKFADFLSPVHLHIIALFNLLHTPYTPDSTPLIIQHLTAIPSLPNRFLLLALLLPYFPFPPLVDLLKSLSNSLSNVAKNYYYYEFHYLFFACRLHQSSTNTPISPGQQQIFEDVYYFFSRNDRLIAPALLHFKQSLDDIDATNQVFESARLVQDYRDWKIPTDFFNSFVIGLRKRLPCQLIRLAIYTLPSTHHSSQDTPAPIFDFSYTSSRGNSTFEKLTAEMISDTLSHHSPLNLDHESINKRFKTPEKAFYYFPHTKTIPWPMPGPLLGILVLAFNSNDYHDYDILTRQHHFLTQFATLIHRFYDTDYRLHQLLNFIIGQSDAIHLLKEHIHKVAKVNFSLLIRGESGTGKELAAKAVHLLSQQSNGPFVPVNAAAIPENLLEAELFGYKKGAFTGANENKTGLIESANHGTLFLDEIADMPLSLQAKLLRVLQENEARRLGENHTYHVDIRLICATNKNLQNLISSQQFRADLFFRIQDLTLDLPPLRQRIEDIPILVIHFMQKFGFSPGIIPSNDFQAIINHFQLKPWPGNIRELESHVKRLITYYPDIQWALENINLPHSIPDKPGLIQDRGQFEKQLILKTLQQCNWKKGKTADILKISRQQLQRLIEKYNFIPPHLHQPGDPIL